MLREIQDLAGQRESVAESLTVGPIRELLGVLTDVKQDRRKVRIHRNLRYSIQHYS